MPWRAGHSRRRRRSDARVSGRSRVERHAHPAPEVRLRGRRPRAPSRNRPRPKPRTTPARSNRRSDASGPFETVRSGRLQGLAPPTSPLCRRHRCRYLDTRSFHGLCSSPRSLALRTSPTECRGRASTARPKPRGTRVAGRRVRPTQASLGSLRRLPLVPRREAGTEADPVAEAAFERPPFQRGVRGPGPRPAPSVRPKPSWNAGQCRWSLSGSEVVRRRLPDARAAAFVTRG